MSYVLTASSKFLNTLGNIVKGLNKAGFSEKDYRTTSEMSVSPVISNNETIGLFDEIDTQKIIELNDDFAVQVTNNTLVSQSADIIAKFAISEQENFERNINNMENNALPNEIQSLVNQFPIKEIFKKQAEKIVLPQFVLKTPANDIFGIKENDMLLAKEHLLKDFQLSRADTNINFLDVTSELYKVDLDETKRAHTPSFVRIDGYVRNEIVKYLLDPAHKPNRVKNFTYRIVQIIGNMYPIADKEIERYVSRVIEDFTDEQFQDMARNEYTYTDKIKQKIQLLSEDYAEKQFKKFLDTNKVFLFSSYFLPSNIMPVATSKNLPKSLYEKEDAMNNFEEQVINAVANLDNVEFWHRNLERGKGFNLNGFINHYPDFIVKTLKDNIILIETKGDHLDNDDSRQKRELGRIWAEKAGANYKYFMVFENKTVEGAYKLDDFLKIMKEI